MARHARQAGIAGSEVLQQPLDVVELELRAEGFAEAAAQLFQDAAGALHVDLARHLDGGVVAVVAPAQRTAERIGLLLRARRPGAARLAVGAGALLLLHHLGEALRALAHGIEGAALGIDRAVGIAVAELTLGIAHGLAGAAELVHLLLALLSVARHLLLAEAALAQLLQQLLELLAQLLLVLLELAELLSLLPLLALLSLLPLLALLPALPALLSAFAPLVLSLPEGAVAQLLLLADHVAQLVERRHHVVVAVAVLHLAGPRGLQVL